MKPIFIFIFCSFFNSHLYASKKITICGKLFSKEDFMIKLYEPINGYFNQASVEFNSNLLKVTKDSFYYSFTPVNDIPLFFSINVILVSKKLPIGMVNFLLCTGDSTHLSIQPGISEDFNWVTFTGDNAEGNNLFQKINFNPVDKFTNMFALLDKLPEQKENFLKNIDTTINAFTSQFELLNNEKKISSQYFQSIKKNFMMIFFGNVVRYFIFPSHVSDKTSQSFRDSVVDNFYQRLSPEDPAIKPLYNSFIYIDSYYRFQAYKQAKVANAVLIENDSIVELNGKSYLIDKIFIHYLSINNLKQREDLWVIQLFAAFQLAPGFFDENIINQFDSFFPNSKYLKLLKDDFKRTSTINDIKYVAQMPISFIDTLIRFNTLDDIISSKYKGKMVFIDFWASWCYPCIASFAYNKSVDSFLLANNIERLYISLDNNVSQWQNAIKAYQLGGSHIIADKYLMNNIKKLLGISNGAGIAIPHYMIYDKSGNLIFKEASDPINTEELFDELKSVINR